MSTILVLRPNLIPSYLKQECKALCAMTTYRKGEFEKDLAPRYTDCLTAIAYLFRSYQYWKLDWIANMPRKLLVEYGFRLEKGMQKGDIVFYANSQGTIRHVSIAVSDLEVFHCSQANKGGKIESIAELTAKRYKKSQLPMYCEITEPFALICQIDPRSYIAPSFNVQFFLKPSKKTENITVNMDSDDSSKGKKNNA